MSEENTQEIYLTEYKEFIDSYQENSMSGEEAGAIITRFAQYFADANNEYANALHSFNVKAADIETETDDNGKILSSSKAKVKSDATVEHHKLTVSKVRVSNIEQMLNAVKSLQRGILAEFSQGASA